MTLLRRIRLLLFWPAAAVVCFAAGGVSGAPTSAFDAEKAVRGWIARDSRPLGADLRKAITGSRTFTDERGEPLFHVVDLRPSGYVVVSADDEVEPIIAFSQSGRYDHSPLNPLCAMLNNDLRSRATVVRERHRGASPDVAKASSRARARWRKLLESTADSSFEGSSSISDVRVPPLVLSKWNQTTECSNACYNYYTPPYAAGSASNYPCGCVATAMAQTMRYFQYPTVGVGTRSFKIYVCGSQQSRSLLGGDGAGGPYVWSQMVLDPGCSTTLAQRQAIGALCADAGVAVNMDYCSGGSGISDLTKVVNAMQNTFKYSNARLAYNGGNELPVAARNKSINANLHAGYPVMLAIIGGVGGHMIVCDGYGYQGSTMYHHLNMGWGGAEDAWYNLPDIDSDPPFSTVAGVVYNIYTSGSGEIIAGRVTDYTGSPIEGAIVSAGAYSDTTDSRGIYALVKVPSNTQFTVTATKAGYDFAPRVVSTGTSTNNSTTCGNLWDVDFSTSSGVDDIIIDDADSQCTYSGGTWNVGTMAGGWPPDASSYHWILTDPPNSGTATWTPEIVVGGKYDIYTYYLQGSNRTAAAPFTVVHSTGTSYYTVNQQTNGSTWYKFASAVELKPGTSGHVILSNNTGETYKAVIADAIKFVYVGPETTPPTSPTGVTASAVSTARVDLSWNASTDNFGVAGYRVYRNAVRIDSVTGLNYSDTGLAANTQYSYTVSAYDEAGNESGQSAQVSRYTLAKAGEDASGSGTGGNVRCINASKSFWYGADKVFTFANTTGFGTGGEWKASRFEYKWNKSPTETWNTPGTSWSSGTISTLPDAGDGGYYLHVRAFNGDNVPNNNDTLDYGPFWCDVSPPAAVTVSDEGSWTCSLTTLRASWTASDDGTGSGINRYEYAVGTTSSTQDV
ncbi:MAG: C10 family peptidase, partial [Armatimonadota bacterium]